MLLVLYLSSWWLLVLNVLIRSGIILRCLLVMLLSWIWILILIKMAIILWGWLVELLWQMLLLLDLFMLILNMHIIEFFWHLLVILTHIFLFLFFFLYKWVSSWRFFSCFQTFKDWTSFEFAILLPFLPFWFKSPKYA